MFRLMVVLGLFAASLPAFSQSREEIAQMLSSVPEGKVEVLRVGYYGVVIAQPGNVRFFPFNDSSLIDGLIRFRQPTDMSPNDLVSWEHLPKARQRYSWNVKDFPHPQLLDSNTYSEFNAIEKEFLPKEKATYSDLRIEVPSAPVVVPRQKYSLFRTTRTDFLAQVIPMAGVVGISLALNFNTIPAPEQTPLSDYVIWSGGYMILNPIAFELTFRLKAHLDRYRWFQYLKQTEGIRYFKSELPRPAFIGMLSAVGVSCATLIAGMAR